MPAGLPSLTRRRPWVAFGLIAAVAAGPASRSADVAAWVADLSADDPAVRDAAEARLVAAGSRAIPALVAAADDAEPDVAARGWRALRRVRLFAVHGATDDALALANRYLSADTPAVRGVVLAELAELKPVPAVVLVRLLTLEPDAALRAGLLAPVGRGYGPAVAGLIADGDLAAVDAVLEQAAADVPDAGPADLAAGQFLTDRADVAVARWRAERTNGGDAQQAVAAAVLFRLARLADDPAAADDVARAAVDPRLRFEAAFDRGDWAAAVEPANACWPGGRSAGVRAGLAALLGHAADAAALASTTPVGDPGLIPPGKARLLVGDAAGGLALLSADPADGGEPVVAFRLLRARGDYDAALALADHFSHDPQLAAALAGPREELRRLLGELPPGPARVVPVAAAEDPAWRQAVTDLAAGRPAAAAAGLAGCEHDPASIDRWYLRGYALAAAGEADAGHRLVRDAVLAPLADVARRSWLADRLAAAGLPADAAAQRDLADRLASPFRDSAATLDLHVARESAATAAHDPVAASAAADRVWLMGFWPGLSWADDPTPYLSVPADAHLARARLARGRDDWPAVAREVDAARGLLPSSVDAPLEWVPVLDGRGDHAAAEALFAAVYDRLDGQSRRHPRSGYLHNQAAWLAACACRRLDAAVAHAEAAVALSPGDWQSLDTLAECRFRTGDRPAAVEIEGRAAALPGADGAYVRRQLARFATAAVPSTTRPADAPG